ncbi:hypothetical protein VTG60DRAFT_6637 [Thermothelomyces hinnuleus]
MWLLDCNNYRLESIDPTERPRKGYWILSHTWCDEEVTFQEMHTPSLAKNKKGYRKIKGMCELARPHGLGYVWIDTCCIDKTSSAELSESINSMFRWHQESARCIVYLEDLAPGTGIATEDELRSCRWFTRGWTLQELLAPREVHFYDSEWKFRGDKTSLIEPLTRITKIDKDALRARSSRDHLGRVPVARKMSWAAGRQSTRLEDKAYCLLGIFDVHMPLSYGEGERAFIRLQQTIAQKVNDMSLFAWIAESQGCSVQESGLFAVDPSEFAACGDFEPIMDPLLPIISWTLTNASLEMTTALDSSLNPEHKVITRCSKSAVRTEPCPGDVPNAKPATHGLALWLLKTPSGFVRCNPSQLCLVKRSAMEFNEPSPIRVATFLTRSGGPDDDHIPDGEGPADSSEG